MALGNTERREFFNLTPLMLHGVMNFSGKTTQVSLKIPNIEFAHIIKRQSLKNFLIPIPHLEVYLLKMVLCFLYKEVFLIRGGKGTVSHVFRLNFEESGLLPA